MIAATGHRELIERSTTYFQPIVDLSTGQVLGAEALVRFVEPDGTLRMPLGTIERFEENPDDLQALAGQGWLWSKAVPAEELEGLIAWGFREQRYSW